MTSLSTALPGLSVSSPDQPWTLQQRLCVFGVCWMLGSPRFHISDWLSARELALRTAKDWTPGVGDAFYEPGSGFQGGAQNNRLWNDISHWLKRDGINVTASQVKTQLNYLLECIYNCDHHDVHQISYGGKPCNNLFTAKANTALIGWSLRLNLCDVPDRDRKVDVAFISEFLSDFCRPFIKEPISTSEVKVCMGGIWHIIETGSVQRNM